LWPNIFNKAYRSSKELFKTAYFYYFGVIKAEQLFKLKAYILSICILVYAFELAALPVICGPVPKPVSKCSGKAKGCPRSTGSSCSSKKAESPCKKSSKPDCQNTAACCINNCPLFYVMTMPGSSMPGNTSGVIKTIYPHYRPSYLFLYASAAWKPPDVC
jgi:hypothetical protein